MDPRKVRVRRVKTNINKKDKVAGRIAGIVAFEQSAEVMVVDLPDRPGKGPHQHPESMPTPGCSGLIHGTEDISLPVAPSLRALLTVDEAILKTGKMAMLDSVEADKFLAGC